ncbi:hypothetical protein KAR91_16475 [Candidatus Pacearchaeota archaeon]|nr:hypothetical protein [Candidatus Pacearchaeota archaeon]
MIVHYNLPGTRVVGLPGKRGDNKSTLEDKVTLASGKNKISDDLWNAVASHAAIVKMIEAEIIVVEKEKVISPVGETKNASGYNKGKPDNGNPSKRR